MDNKVITVTTPTLEGYKILEYVDLVYDEVCFSQKLTSQLKNLINDGLSYLGSIFEDTELNGTSNAIMKAKEFLLERLKQQAIEKGANAIVGIDFESSLGTSMTFVRVSVNGTAVKVKKIEELEKEEKEKQAKEQEEIRIKKEKEEKIENLRNSQILKKNFIFEDHEEEINKFEKLDELIQYLELLRIEDSFFNDEVIPSIKEYKDLERLYGSMLNSAINKLKEMTTK